MKSFKRYIVVFLILYFLTGFLYQFHGEYLNAKSYGLTVYQVFTDPYAYLRSAIFSFQWPVDVYWATHHHGNPLGYQQPTVVSSDFTEAQEVTELEKFILPPIGIGRKAVEDVYGKAEDLPDSSIGIYKLNNGSYQLYVTYEGDVVRQAYIPMFASPANNDKEIKKRQEEAYFEVLKSIRKNHLEKLKTAEWNLESIELKANATYVKFKELGLNEAQVKKLLAFVKSMKKQKESIVYIEKCDFDVKNTRLIKHELLQELFKDYYFVKLHFIFALKNPETNYPGNAIMTAAVNKNGSIQLASVMADNEIDSDQEFSSFLKKQNIKVASKDDVRNIVRAYNVLNSMGYGNDPVIEKETDNSWKAITAKIKYANFSREYFCSLETENDFASDFKCSTKKYK